MTYYYHTEEDIREQIDVLLEENAAIQCNLGTESTDAERKEADDKWRVIAAKIKTFRYESVNGSDYLLTIDVDLPENTAKDRFLLVIPNEVTRHKNRP